jgi:hypothetical protein
MPTSNSDERRGEDALESEFAGDEAVSPETSPGADSLRQEQDTASAATARQETSASEPEGGPNQPPEADVNDAVNPENLEAAEIGSNEKLQDEIAEEEEKSDEEVDEAEEENPEDPTHEMPPRPNSLIDIASELVGQWAKELRDNSLVILYSGVPLLRQSAMYALAKHFSKFSSRLVLFDPSSRRQEDIKLPALESDKIKEGTLIFVDASDSYGDDFLMSVPKADLPLSIHREKLRKLKRIVVILTAYSDPAASYKQIGIWATMPKPGDPSPIHPRVQQPLKALSPKDGLERTVLFLATYFPDLPSSDFSRVLLELLGPRPCSVALPTTDKQTTSVAEGRLLRDLWIGDEEQTLADCGLLVEESFDRERIVHFASEQQREGIKHELVKKHRFEFELFRQRVRQLALIYDPQVSVSTPAIDLLCEWARNESVDRVRDLLVEMLLAATPDSAPQATRGYERALQPRLKLVFESLTGQERQFVFVRLAALASRLGSQAAANNPVERFIAELVKYEFYAEALELGRRACSLPCFRTLVWRPLLNLKERDDKDKGRREIRRRVKEQILSACRNVAGLVDVLPTLSQWIKETSPPSSLGEVVVKLVQRWVQRETATGRKSVGHPIAVAIQSYPESLPPINVIEPLVQLLFARQIEQAFNSRQHIGWIIRPWLVSTSAMTMDWAKRLVNRCCTEYGRVLRAYGYSVSAADVWVAIVLMDLAMALNGSETMEVRNCAGLLWQQISAATADRGRRISIMWNGLEQAVAAGMYLLEEELLRNPGLLNPECRKTLGRLRTLLAGAQRVKPLWTGSRFAREVKLEQQ